MMQFRPRLLPGPDATNVIQSGAERSGSAYFRSATTAMMVARYTNLAETIDELGYPVPWDRGHFKRVLTARMDRGEAYLGPAYKITGGKRGQGTIAYLADDVLNRLWRSREHLSPALGITLAAYCDRLMDFDGVGSFMAAQNHSRGSLSCGSRHVFAMCRVTASSSLRTLQKR